MKRRSIARVLGALGFLALVPASANALLFRTYVASTGNDSNPCTLQAPCRLLPAALAAASGGGEIWMLDSANFNSGTVTIDRSIAILAVPGAVGSLVATSGPAVQVTSAGLKVALRNVVVVPIAGAVTVNGITMSAASTLSVEDSLIANLPGTGVDVIGAGTVNIANSIIRDNVIGVRLRDGANANISNSRLLMNRSQGVAAETNTATTTTATIGDTVISGPNAGDEGPVGVLAVTYNASALSRVNLTRCVLEGHLFAVASSSNNTGSAAVALSYSMITNNRYGWYQDGSNAFVRSFGNNHFQDNLVSVGLLANATMQ